MPRPMELDEFDAVLILVGLAIACLLVAGGLLWLLGG